LYVCKNAFEVVKERKCYKFFWEFLVFDLNDMNLCILWWEVV
jgi:hypothetical protein